LGRSTKDNQIDVDLALEGPAWKISRRQGVIRLKKNGEFSIVNEGKRPIYVDGRAVLMGCRDVLRNNSVIEVRDCSNYWLINNYNCSVLYCVPQLYPIICTYIMASLAKNVFFCILATWQVHCHAKNCSAQLVNCEQKTLLAWTTVCHIRWLINSYDYFLSLPVIAIIFIVIFNWL